MELQIRHNYNFIILLTVAIIFSSFTLWLIEESSIKYPLFVIEIGIIIVIYLILNNSDFSNKNRVFNFLSLYLVPKSAIFADLLLVIFSTILLTFSIFPVEGLLLLYQLVFAFLCVSFLSGFAILNIFKINRYLSRLEYVVLSYVVSFILSGFITLGLLSVDENTRSILIPVLFLSIGSISAVYRIKRTNNTDTAFNSPSPSSPSPSSPSPSPSSPSSTITFISRPKSLCKNIDILAIFISIVFYSTFIYVAYPDFTLNPNNDITRHYNYSLILSRTPDLYAAFNYFIFHGFQATFHVLSGLNQPLASFQTIQVVLNLFLPLAVYIFAKRYLTNIDKRIPALATIFYSVFSNLSFIYFVKLKLVDNATSTVEVLRNTAENTLNGTIYFLQPFPWFTPLSVSFVMFIVAFFLLRLHDLPRLKFVVFFSVLVVSTYLTHVTEATIFAILLAMYSIFFARHNNNKLRIDDVLISLLLSFTFLIFFSYFISYSWDPQLNQITVSINSLLSLLVPLLLTSIALLLRKVLYRYLNFKFKIIPKLMNNIKLNKYYYFLFILYVFFYLFILYEGLFNDNTTTSTYDLMGISPWFAYPLMLGIMGILAFLSIKYLGSAINRSSYVMIIPFVIIFIILLGRLISYTNQNIIYTSYWEKRFIIFIFFFISTLAPLPLIKLADHLSLRKARRFPIIFISIVISVIVLFGFSSMTLQYNFWYALTTSDQYKVNNKEFQAVMYLKSILQKDPLAFVISPSGYSDSLLRFAVPGYIFSIPDLLMFSKYPAIPLYALSYHGLDHAYIYIHHVLDSEILESSSQSWFTKNLLPTLPMIYSNEEVTIYNVSRVSFPLPQSDTALIKPTEDFEPSFLFGYDLISKLGINYTVFLYNDPKIFSSEKLILTIDPIEYYNYNKTFNSEVNNEWDILNGNWNFSPDGLHGLDKMDSDDRVHNLNNVILRSFIGENPSTIKTSFGINDLNQSEPNYASVIYSLKDQRNYKQAGINIYKDDIYALFSTVRNGTLIHDVDWPGIKTDLKWIPTGVHFDMKLAINGTNQDLIINGTKYLSHNDTKPVENGNVGLSYFRIKDILFNQFQMNKLNDVYKEIVSKYIPYVNGGGNLIVFNTNGYGTIFDSYFSIDRQDDDIDNDPFTLFNNTFAESENNDNFTIFSAKKTEFEDELYEKDSDKDTQVIKNKNISTYTTSESITVSTRSVGQGNITYIDLIPLLTGTREYQIINITNNRLNDVLPDILSMQPLDNFASQKKNFDDMEIVASFKEITGIGNLTLESQSIIFPELDSINLKAVTYENETIDLKDITNLEIYGYNKVLLEGINNNYTIKNGKGLYSNILLDKDLSSIKSTELMFQNSIDYPNTIVTGNIKGKPFALENVSKIYVIGSDPLHFYSRQPQLNILGETTFSDLHANLNYARDKFIPGMDYQTYGNSSLSIFMSDIYSFANSFSISNYP